MGTALADIGDRQSVVVRKLSLQVDVPLIGGRVLEGAIIHLESRPRGGEKIWPRCRKSCRNWQCCGEAGSTRTVSGNEGSVERRILGHRVGIVGFVRGEDAEASTDHSLGRNAEGEARARAEVG